MQCQNRKNLSDVCQLPLGEAGLEGPAGTSERLLTGLDRLMMSWDFCPFESEPNLSSCKEKVDLSFPHRSVMQLRGAHGRKD